MLSLISAPLEHSDQNIGRVYLLPERSSGTKVIYLLKNHNRTLVYSIVLDTVTRHNRWRTIILDSPPDYLVPTREGLFSNYNGSLYQILLGFEGRLGDKEFLLPSLNHGDNFDLSLFIPGFSYALEYESAHFLNYLIDFEGCLHVFIASDDSDKTQVYCFEKVTVLPLGLLHMCGMFMRCKRIAHIAFGLLLKLSNFWSNGDNQWEPVAWITPPLVPIDQRCVFFFVKFKLCNSYIIDYQYIHYNRSWWMV